MKFFNTLAASAAIALALAAAPATAQEVTPLTTTSATPSTGWSMTGWMTGMSGGETMYGFGTLDANGNLVAGNNITGSGESTKTGGSNAEVKYNYAGCGQPVPCPPSGSSQSGQQVLLSGYAWENARASVTTQSAAPGQITYSVNGTKAAARLGGGVSFSYPNTSSNGH